MAKNDAFMMVVMLHERAWGLETYRGRPTLKQIMAARVVAFWHPTTPEMAFTVTLHKDLKDIDRYVQQLVWHTKKNLPRLRLAKVFLNQKEVKIKGIKVIFDYVE